MQRISMVALRATARQVIRGVALVGAANVQAHSDRRAEKTAEAAKYDAFGPNHGGAFRPFDCGRAAGRLRPARERWHSPPFAHC